jgi:alginate O-acetyltransferase complex protein AlgI
MLFNSIDFAIFLPIVFIIYWFVTNRNLKLQNFFIVVASYVFYGWWDWRFLSLLFATSVLDYFIGLGLGREENERKRKMYLWMSIVLNLGLLGVFKYYNFFADNFAAAFTFFGHSISVAHLKWILPVGISFYTFQEVSYVIDIYRRKLEPTKDIVAFLAFVSFFPQLVAGPIERAVHLLPQFYKRRTFDYDTATDGLRQMLWGLFKKVVIADNCAIFVDHIFDNYTTQPGSALILALFIHAIQVYTDFSGYSDIGIGCARLFGFNLMANFAFPFFSRDIAEFWRRFHISLSTWFRDYVYIPLGGGKKGKLIKIRNIMIVFLIMGFWHGAEWRYIALGAMHGLYFIPLILLNRERNHMEIAAHDKSLPSITDLLKMFRTLSLYSLALVFFRSTDIKSSFSYLNNIVTSKFLMNWKDLPKTILLLISILMVVEWIARREKFGIANIKNISQRGVRWGIYVVIIASMFYFVNSGKEFIYFQF